MPQSVNPQTIRVSVPKKVRFAGPIWTLILVAPFVAEVLGGSTRLSFLFVYLPEVMVWGVGALLCRELVRRWRAGASSLLLLGLALAVAEEFVIQQTSLAPLPFPGANAHYGRLWGVNWIYLLFMLGFESVWVVLVPVQLTELAYSSRREKPWLQTKGLILSCIILILGSFLAWYGWTQQALPRMHAAPYHPPVVTVALGLLAIVLLGFAAYRLRGTGSQAPSSNKRAVPAWLVFLTTLILGAGWYGLLTLVFVPNAPLPAGGAILAGLFWATATFVILRRWSDTAEWSDSHRLAVAVGAMLATMAVPYLTISTYLRIDVIGIVIFDLCAIFGALLLGSRVHARAGHS